MAHRGRALVRRFLSVLLPVTALSGLILMTGAAGASAAPIRGASPAAAAGFTPPPDAGVVTEIVLDNGGYKRCLNYTGGKTTEGTKVELWTCNSNDAASQWVISVNRTLEPYNNPSMTVSSVNGQLVLTSIERPIGNDYWYFSADGEIVNDASSPPASPYVLNDPGYRTANGTQLITYQQGAVTSNAHWYLPKAHYATSKLTSRPDPGGNGAWATDTITRQSMVVYTGPVGPLPNPHNYQFDASVVDHGNFTTIPGAYTPNQTGQFGPTNQVLGPIPLFGTITGHANYIIQQPHFVSRAPAAAYSGASQPATGSFPYLFFPPPTAWSLGAATPETTGADQDDFSYVSGMDACGQFETWTQLGDDYLGQNADAGNITAPTVANCPS
jgi:Ricin-type beta-trefoil lectin domain